MRARLAASVFTLLCGAVRRHANGDVYEGEYKDGKKHGPGTFK